MGVLHSKIIGAGKPLVILHGFLGMSDNWKTLGNKYAENGFKVHLVDQRNHGRSFWSSEFNYQVLAGDVLAYLNHHDIESTSVIGHSMGGKTAMQFACANPQRTEKLIVADIAPKFYPPHHQNIVNALVALEFGEISSRDQADKALEANIGQVGVRQFLLKNLYWIEKGRLGFRFNLNVLQHKMEEIGENLAPGSVYMGDTLFLKGEYSDYITNNDVSNIKMYFPQAEITTVAKSGHWLHAQNPRHFLEHSLTFLNR